MPATQIPADSDRLADLTCPELFKPSYIESGRRYWEASSAGALIAVHVTTCRLFAHATVGNLRIGFDADGAKLEPHNFRATCAHSTDDGREVAMGEIPERVQVDCAREISAEVARRIEISKPRKLTFAQVQRIYGRAVD